MFNLTLIQGKRMKITRCVCPYGKTYPPAPFPLLPVRVMQGFPAMMQDLG